MLKIRTSFLFLFAAIIGSSAIVLPAKSNKCLDFLQIDYGSNQSRIVVVEGFATNLTISLDRTADSDSACSQVYFRLKLAADSPQRSSLNGDSDFSSVFTLTQKNSLQLEVKGVFVGHSKILLQTRNTNSSSSSNDTTDWSTFKEAKIATYRRRRPRDAIFQGIVFALIIFGNAGIGLNVNWKEIGEVLRRPIGPAIGFCCQYIIMPLTAFTVVKLISLEPSIALGIFIVGCSPGGGGSNYHTYFLGGHLPLSVTMTILSTIAALAMMPFWIYTLGRLVAQGTSDGTEISIAFQGIGASLASTVFPFGVGILVRWCRPILADKLFRFGVRPMLVVIFLYLITAGLLTNLYVFKLIDTRILLAAVVLPYAGFSLGFGTAYVLRQGFSKSITIAIETGIQSAGVAMGTLMLSLPQPDCDIAVVGPIATTMLTPIPLWIAEISLGIYLCIKKKRCFIFDSCRKGSEKDAISDGGDVEKDDRSKEKPSQDIANSTVMVPLVSPDSDDL